MKQPQPTTILRHHCRQKTPAMLLSVDSGRLCHASFRRVTAESVKLAVFDFTRGVPFHPLDIAVVSFHDGERGSLFMSTVLDVRPAGESIASPELVLSMPQDMFRSERRAMLRLRLGSATELAVTLQTKDGNKWRPRPLNISLGGLLLEFDAEENLPDLRIDQRVSLNLALQDQSLALAGSVRWRKNRRCGLSFPEVVQGATIKPPEELRRIVEHLEREWLRQGILTKPAA